MTMPDQIIICDIESTHKIIACAEIITIAFIKTDLKLNIIEKRSWKMAPKYWGVEHNAAMEEAHKIPRDEAMGYPDKKEVLREIFKWFGAGPYIFCGHFNRDNFGSKSSFDYALLGQEFWDQSHEAYSRFGRIFPRQFILSTHTCADVAHKVGKIHVPLVLKEGNKQASRDFGLKSICKIMGVSMGEHHTAEDDANSCFQILKKFLGMIDIFEVINNDWRSDDEQSDNLRKAGSETNAAIHEQWNRSGEFFSGNHEEVEEQ